MITTTENVRPVGRVMDRADILWGVSVIAAFIGRTETSTYYLLNTGAIPARKIKGRWTASRRTLQAFFDGATQ